MKAVRINSANTVSIAEIGVPEPGPGEVAMDVAYVGYCGSDLASFRGLNPLVSYPRVPGHEIAGTVVAVGRGVDDLAIGTEATVLPYFNCGKCRACRAARVRYPRACGAGLRGAGFTVSVRGR